MTQEERLEKKKAYTGPVYEVPAGETPTPCKTCGQSLYWVKTPAGSWMPTEYDGMPHWGFCNRPDEHRK